MACKERIHSDTNAIHGNKQITTAISGGPYQRKGSQAVSEEFVADTLNHLRAVLLSSKEGLTPKQILYDYLYFVGEPLPYLHMGHPDLVSFLDSFQHVCERVIENGQMLYRPVRNERCDHIRRLVESQRSEPRKPRSRKRKSISINDENDAPPKRSKSDPRKSFYPTAEENRMEAPLIDSAPRYFNHLKNLNPSTPIDKNKSVHFEDLLVNANNAKPQQRQRSRTRLPFFHKDDPSKPKFKGFRRRGKSTSALPVSTPIAVTTTTTTTNVDRRRGKSVTGTGKGASGTGKAVEMTGKNSMDVVSSSTSSKRRFSRLGNPEMVTSTPRRSTPDIPVPADIRKDLLTTLADFPEGVLVHEIPAAYQVKLKRDLPDFLTSSKALTEFFSCLTADVRVIRQGLGAVRIKLLQFDAVAPTVDVAIPTSTTTSGGSSQSAKSRVVETLLRILSRHARGIYLSRLRVEYKKLTRELIPYQRLGFVSERLFLASMPENFTLRTMTTDPRIQPEYIVSAAVLPLPQPTTSAILTNYAPSSAVLPDSTSSRSS